MALLKWLVEIKNRIYIKCYNIASVINFSPDTDWHISSVVFFYVSEIEEGLNFCCQHCVILL